MSSSTNTNLIARTALSGLLQTYLLTGLPINKLAYTTLNERLTINADAQVASTDRPTFAYWVIGDKGHYNTPVADGEVIIEPAQHTAGDFAAFNQIPFVLKKVTEDFSAADRAKYALRRIEEHDGENYFAYYAKKVDFTDAVPIIQRTTVVDGVSTTKDYVPNTSNLYPTRQTIPTNSATTTSSDYLTVSLSLEIPFTEDDVAELNNVASILYGSEKRSIISEIGLVSAIQRSVSAPSVGTEQINMVEAIYAQVLTWLSTYRQMSFDNQGFTISLELGANEPMNTASSVSVANSLSTVTATITSNA